MKKGILIVAVIILFIVSLFIVDIYFRAPEVEIKYPNDNSTNVELNPLITWNATDSKIDTIRYKIYLNNELLEDNYESKSYQLSNLKTNTKYTIKIVAIDKNNLSDESSVTFKTTRAPIIALNSPRNNSYTERKIILSWTANDLDKDRLTFDVYMDTNPNPTTKVKSDITEFSIPITLDEYNKYYWKVVAKDSKGAKAESLIYNFIYDKNWQKTYGGSKEDKAYSIQQTTDGGYIIAGYTYSKDGDVSYNNGDSDVWIIKLDKNMNLEWQKTYGGSNIDRAFSIQQTSDGGYVVAGYTYSKDGDVSINRGKSDFWIIKLDANGILEWEKTFGGSASDQAYSIQQTSDGGYAVAGYTYSKDGDVSINRGKSDFWIIKLDLNGILEWEKTFGGSASDQAYSIQQTNDGGYIVVGNTEGRILDGFIIKLDENGNLEWYKVYYYTNWDYLYTVQQTSDGGYIVAGHTNGNYLIIKLDENGNLEWDKIFGGSKVDVANSINQTRDGGYIVAGYTQSSDGDISINRGKTDFSIIKLDVNGNLEWEKTYGGSEQDYAESIQQTRDGGYVVAGYTQSTDGDVLYNHGGSDVWVIKLDKDGKIEWDKIFGGSAD